MQPVTTSGPTSNDEWRAERQEHHGPDEVGLGRRGQRTALRLSRESNTEGVARFAGFTSSISLGLGPRENLRRPVSAERFIELNFDKA